MAGWPDGEVSHEKAGCQRRRLVTLQRYVEARDRLEAALKVHPDSRELLHALARLPAAAPDARARDGGRAVARTQALVERHQIPEARETMAMALAEAGRFEEAVAWQRGVITAAKEAGRHELVPHLSGTLDSYKVGWPSRTPWREGEMP